MKLNKPILYLIPWAYLLLALLTVRIYMTNYIFFSGKTPLLISYILITFLVALYPGYKCIQQIGGDKAYRFLNIYMLYTIVSIVYSYLANYLETDSVNQFKLFSYYLAGTSCLSVYFFSSPEFFTKGTKLFYRILPFLFLILLPLTREGLEGDMAGNLLAPALLPILFWKDLNFRSKIIYSVIAVFVIITSFEGDARSNLIKFSVAFFLGLFINRYFTKVFKYLVWAIMLIPFILFYLGVSGQFNIFQETEKQQVSFNEELNEYSLIDTRTTIYTEALASATRNKKIIWGRGLGRGYQSNLAWQRLKAQEYTARSYYETEYSRERNSEVGIVNLFLWGGVVYVLIYTIMMVSALFYGLYRSSNKYVTSVAVFLSFYYVYDWVENVQGMVVTYFVFWFFVAICLSPFFRNMTDLDFKAFIKRIF